LAKLSEGRVSDVWQDKGQSSNYMAKVGGPSLVRVAVQTHTHTHTHKQY